MAKRSNASKSAWQPAPSAKTRRIAMFAYPDTQILDVTGPLEVFSRTSRHLRAEGQRKDDAYSVEIIGLERGETQRVQSRARRGTCRRDAAS